MKKLRHSVLPLTLECTDVIDTNMLQAIDIHMTAYGWDTWIDEYGNWFRPFNKNPNQLELFDDV